MIAQLFRTLLTGAAGVLLGIYVGKKAREPHQNETPKVRLIFISLMIINSISNYIKKSKFMHEISVSRRLLLLGMRYRLQRIEYNGEIPN
jgi:hypothetical protein